MSLQVNPSTGVLQATSNDGLLSRYFWNYYIQTCYGSSAVGPDCVPLPDVPFWGFSLLMDGCEADTPPEWITLSGQYEGEDIPCNPVYQRVGCSPSPYPIIIPYNSTWKTYCGPAGLEFTESEEGPAKYSKIQFPLDTPPGPPWLATNYITPFRWRYRSGWGDESWSISCDMNSYVDPDYDPDPDFNIGDHHGFIRIRFLYAFYHQLPLHAPISMGFTTALYDDKDEYYGPGASLFVSTNKVGVSYFCLDEDLVAYFSGGVDVGESGYHGDRFATECAFTGIGTGLTQDADTCLVSGSLVLACKNSLNQSIGSIQFDVTVEDCP